MTTRSVVLAAGSVLSELRDTIAFVCPEATHTLVKSFAISKTVAEAIIVYAYLIRPQVAPQVFVHKFDLTTVPVEFFECWFVLEPGDELVLLSQPAGCGYWISGALLPVAT